MTEGGAKPFSARRHESTNFGDRIGQIGVERRPSLLFVGQDLIDPRFHTTSDVGEGRRGDRGHPVRIRAGDAGSDQSSRPATTFSICIVA